MTLGQKSLCALYAGERPTRIAHTYSWRTGDELPAALPASPNVLTAGENLEPRKQRVLLPETPIFLTVTPCAESDKISKPVCFLVRTEKTEWDSMVYVQMLGSVTLHATESVTFKGRAPRFIPTWPAIILMPAAPCGISFAKQSTSHSHIIPERR